MTVSNKGRSTAIANLVCAAILTLCVAGATSGCATTNQEGALYRPSDNADASTTNVSEAELAMLYNAQSQSARWVDGDPETMYPDRYRSRGAQANMTGSSAKKERQVDNRDPRGWTRRELIQQWGIPAKIEGARWIYRVPNETCKGQASTKKIEFQRDKVKSVRLQKSSHC